MRKPPIRERILAICEIFYILTISSITRLLMIIKILKPKNPNLIGPMIECQNEMRNLLGDYSKVKVYGLTCVECFILVKMAKIIDNNLEYIIHNSSVRMIHELYNRAMKHKEDK